jgi:hypothetical protein
MMAAHSDGRGYGTSSWIYDSGVKALGLLTPTTVA